MEEDRIECGMVEWFEHFIAEEQLTMDEIALQLQEKYQEEEDYFDVLQ